jgi:sortase (surface protein transpeptidase)
VKLALLVAVIASLALAGSAYSAQPQALLTIPALGIFNKPIGNGDAMLKSGPTWDPYVPARPTRNNFVVIAGHDVTPVPGYGGHGPFYNLVELKKGYLVEVRWRTRLYVYRLVRDSWYMPEREVPSAVVGVGLVWLYSCYPRHTHNGRTWAEGVLVSVSNATQASNPTKEV